MRDLPATLNANEAGKSSTSSPSRQLKADHDKQRKQDLLALFLWVRPAQNVSLVYLPLCVSDGRAFRTARNP